MKLHVYLEQVVGSKVSLAVIRALVNHPGKVFTIRKLAEDVGASPSETAIVVRKLEEAGALKLQPVGRSHLIVPNENSFVFGRIIKPIVAAENGTVEFLVKLLRRQLKNKAILSAYVFGSVAKGEDREDSDIDLLVISNNFEKASAIVSKVQSDVTETLNKRVSPLILSEIQLASKKARSSQLLASIKTDHIYISGKDLFEEGPES
jgi:predicted nucleotidyltransferase